MKYAKRIGLFTSAIVLGLVFMSVSASAQVRVGVQFGRGYYRPRVVSRVFVPDPFWYNGYYGDPYWRTRRSERYYDRESVGIARRRLNKDEDKYYADGYISPKEQKKLDSDHYKLSRDRRRLRDDW